MEYPDQSPYLLVSLEKGDIALFRFLLEAYENLAFFSVLEKDPPLLKLVFAPESRKEVERALMEISGSVKIMWKEWPLR